MYAKPFLPSLRQLPCVVLLCSFGLTALSCNDHKVQPLDQVLTASNRLENRLPAKTKLDFLFVIDNSSSMGEEQQALAQNFRTFSDFLFDELQEAADYRIAVTNTGMFNETLDLPSDRAGCTANDTADGRFLYEPANPMRPVYSPSIQVNGELLDPSPPIMPLTADCAESSPIVISSKDIEDRALNELPAAPIDDPDCADPASPACEKVRRKLLLEKEFRCHSTLGTEGCSVEKGLEAMRTALSCSGPNAELFKTCCIGYNENDPSQNLRSTYDPLCVYDENDEATAPKFLRPDATLVIIFISDENDCSTPEDNPFASTRFICQPGWGLDDNGDGIPDVYDRCGLDPSRCFDLECGPYRAQGAQVCHDKRCEVPNYNGLGCEYNAAQSLVSISEYRDFLLKLKARPIDQLLVATIVGFRQYLTDINGELVLDGSQNPQVLSYSSEVPLDECRGLSGPEVFTDRCCPNGVCRTNQIKYSCDLIKRRPVDCAQLGESSEECVDFCDVDLMSCGLEIFEELRSQPGTRYLELAESLGENGLGCPQGAEPTVIEETGQVIPQGDNTCVNLCVDDFIVPLRAIKERVADLLNTYCINRLPSCVVPATYDGNGALLTTARPCDETELNTADNYAQNMRVSRRCRLTIENGGNCSEIEELRELEFGTEWTFSLGTEGCDGVVELTRLPPAGSEIFIDFVVSAGERTFDGDETEP